MKNLALLQALAGGAVAQHMTLPVIDNAAIVAAMNPTDQGYKICSAVNQKVHGCVSQVGGLSGLTTAASTVLAKCACCNSGCLIAGAYSSCSSYLTQEAPTLSAQYSAYGTLYSLCNLNNACSGSAAASPTGITASATGAPAPSDSGTSSGSLPSTVTSISGLGSVAPACSSMVGLYTSCSMDIQGFSDLPLGLQAPCYCCITARGQATWTDELDKYAQTCRDWASASGPATIYSLAKTYAGFCKNFSNACSASSTLGSSEATATSTDAQTTGNPDSTITGNTGGQTATTTTKAIPASTGAASNLRVGSAAGLVAFAAVAAAF
ncbi:hypothetical protein TOPH_03019 [Tolypocladium ophioglossoides CBS 100239]|uniref:Uncharacterized protein n=1 Tax=Tolypocladium ophioglossoides (strain CBS 100239) TaxID=1163406 RepID=A0A0L0NDV6_TOLOC|nr:hypothetical protein TOPH_03019 [Tolypocladium ophioglossoides CBS 100239]